MKVVNNLREADRYPKWGSGEPRLKSTWQHCTGEPQARTHQGAVLWCFSGLAGSSTPNWGKETVIVLSQGFT